MSFIAPFSFRQQRIEVAPTPPPSNLFPNWEQNFNNSLAIEYLNALDALSGSTAQQMQDMNWELSASLVTSINRDYEAAVVYDGFIIAYDFTRQYILKIDTETNTTTEIDLGSAQIASRARAGFYPSGSDSVFFVNRDDQALRYRPSDNFTEVFTSASSDSTTGPTNAGITFDWKVYNAANNNAVGNKNSIWSVDSNNSMSMDLYTFTGSFQGRTPTTDTKTGKPVFHAFNDTNPALTIIGNELVTTGSSAGYTTNTILGDTAQLVPYYSQSVRGNDEDGMVLIPTADGWNQSFNNGAFGLWRDNQYYNTDLVTGVGSIRITTIGPDGRVYAVNEENANSILAYDWKSDNAEVISVSGASIQGSTSGFSHRIYTATNGAMYLIPLVNGQNVYRISPPLTGSNADNIKNLTLSLFTNRG